MRRILLGLAVLLVASLAGGAQAEQGPWQPQLTLYSGDFYSVAFASSSTVWAAGPGGIVLSEDGGASWHWASNESVLSVTAADATQGWAVGAGGTILATIDGGRTWTQQQSPTPTGLYTVGALDAQRAIAVGEGAGCDVCLPSYDGVVLVTEDGGITWRQAQLPGKYEPISLSVLAGGSNAWLSAEECIPVENGPSGCDSQDVLLASSDSGKTWEEISTQQVSEMQFTSPSTGWALDVRGLIRTKDGGKSWQRLQDFSSQGKYVSKLTLLSDRVLLLLEQDQTRPTQQIIKSTDGGTSWVPVGDESSGYLPFVLRFFDEKHAIRSGFSRPLEQTKDGGITWQAAAAPAFAFINRYNLEFDFVDPSNGWVAGTKLLRTSDAGSSWETVSDLQLNSIDFVSPTEGWAIKTVGDPVSCQIIVLHTSDGGVSWSQQATSKCLDRDTSTIRFVDKRNGWVNRGPGLPLLHTRDGGLNWSDQQPPSNSLVFVDASTVWALSSPDTSGNPQADVFLSRDGGDSWSQTTPIVLAGPGDTRLSAIDASHAWVLSPSVLYRTADGGAHWERSTTNVNGSPSSLTFLSLTNGLATVYACRTEGEGGCEYVLLRTTDGGLSWSSEHLPSGADGLERPVFTDPWHGWVAETTGGDMASPLQKQILYAYSGTPPIVVPVTGQGPGDGIPTARLAPLFVFGVLLVCVSSLVKRTRAPQ